MHATKTQPSQVCHLRKRKEKAQHSACKTMPPTIRDLRIYNALKVEGKEPHSTHTMGKKKTHPNRKKTYDEDCKK